MIAKKLKYGDTIGVIAPSFEVDEKNRYKAENAVKFFEEKGFRVKMGKHIYKSWFGSAGTPQERAFDFNAMFADKEVDAIICLNGGGTSNTMLPYIDFNNVAKNPKIFMGYSDISVLLQTIYDRTGLITFNGPLFMDFGEEQYLSEHYRAFEERLIDGRDDIQMDEGAVCVREGIAEGKLLGTNIKCSMHLMGTEYFPNYEDKLVALEAYYIEPFDCSVRIAQLLQNGYFDKINGAIVGYVANLQKEIAKGNRRPQLEEILLEMTKEYDFPILKCNIFGHDMANAIIPIGANMRLDAGKKELKILEPFLE